ncbi:MAG TPA: bifunctional 4-hydroxy-2-oxoglutarate aldolase/2-dehydro-3-deoxy-phosphogluconate aldolase [Thermoanaerobaculia bacterium]
MSWDRMAVLNAMVETGLVPVFYEPDVEVARGILAACARGGARCVEFTNRGDFAPHVFLELARHLAKSEPRVALGVGSIVDAPTAALYIANGARFVVGPVLNAEVARLCNRRKVPYSPGCGSATEISEAEELGCEIVKIFPGGAVGGPDFVKSVLGPCPWTRLMPTGGAVNDEASLKSWFDAGVACVGIGTNLLTKDLVARRDFDGIERRVRECLALIAKVRGRG